MLNVSTPEMVWFMDDCLPIELIVEIGNFLSLREFNGLLLLNKKLFERFSADCCYVHFYWNEINYHCNVKKECIYNPSIWMMHSEVHPLHSKYSTITDNYRKHLIQFRKEFTGCRQHFPFTPLKNLTTTTLTMNLILEKRLYIYGKVLLIGNGIVGKTTLILRVSNRNFLFQDMLYTPCMDNFSLRYKNLECFLWDSAGQEDYDRLRALIYPDTSLILMCFSLVDRKSFNALKNKWIHEVRYNVRDVPIILVGCKQDLREKDETKHIQSEEAEELARYFGCISYWETSSKTGFGTENSSEIIVNGCSIGLQNVFNKKSSKKKCFMQ